MNSKRFASVVCLVGVFAFAGMCSAWEIESKLETGVLTFDENLRFMVVSFAAPTLSEHRFDFNDHLYYNRFEVTAGDYDFDGLEGGVEVGFWTTEADESEFDFTFTMNASLPEGFVPVVKEELSAALAAQVQGLDLHAELGWGGELGDEGHRWAVLVGYGFKKTKVDRIVPLDHFLELEVDAMNDRDSLYDIHYLDFAGRLEMDITDDIAFLLESSIGPVLSSSRANDFWGDIEGSGGLVLKVEGLAVWTVTENVHVEAGAFYDLESLEGGARAIGASEGFDMQEGESRVEWDDHVVEAFGASVGVNFLL